MLKLSRNNQNVRGPPEHSAISNIHRDILFGYYYITRLSFKPIAGGFNSAFWWYGPLSEDQDHFKQIYQNYLVALKGGEEVAIVLKTFWIEWWYLL